MAAARIVMGEWGEIYTRIMLQAELKIWMKGFYVDDVRTVTSVLKKGMRWDIIENKFLYKEEWRVEDEIVGDTNTTRMSKQVNLAMNSIFENINFTMETAEDFPEKKLPTLDFKLWVEKDEQSVQQIRYSFFEKVMKTPYCILARSAMAEQSKYSSLTQDLIRRLTNTKEDSSQEEKNDIVEIFVERLQISGYSRAEIREIIVSGLKGYVSKIEKAKSEGRGVHRSSASTLLGRQKKRLTGKTSWYKAKKKENGERDLKNVKTKTSYRGTFAPKSTNKTELETKSLLFVPRTKGGELAKRLRTEEDTLAKITGYRVKIVERGGTMVKRVVHKSNLWSGKDCDREDCPICSQEGDLGDQDCLKRNILYQTSCLECRKKGKDVSYYGESSRSAYERSKEHFSDYEKLSSKSHMVKHHVLEHQEIEGKISFSVKILRFHRTAFSRQIHEAVKIQLNENNNILNSKGEYSRCRLPRLRAILNKNEKENLEDSEITEEELEAEIRRLGWKKRKRARNKEKDTVEIQEPPNKKKMRWKSKHAVKRKDQDGVDQEGHQEYVHRSKKRRINEIPKKEKIQVEVTAHNSTAQARVCDNTQNIAENSEEGRHYQMLVTRNVSNENVQSKINLFENLSTLCNENISNLETKIYENDQNLSKPMKHSIKTPELESKNELFPIFTAPFKTQNVVEKTKLKPEPNQACLPVRHHQHRRPTTGIKSRNFKTRTQLSPAFRFKKLSDHFNIIQPPPPPPPPTDDNKTSTKVKAAELIH